jgi:hypothetical protein
VLAQRGPGGGAEHLGQVVLRRAARRGGRRRAPRVGQHRRLLLLLLPLAALLALVLRGRRQRYLLLVLAGQRAALLVLVGARVDGLDALADGLEHQLAAQRLDLLPAALGDLVQHRLAGLRVQHEELLVLQRLHARAAPRIRVGLLDLRLDLRAAAGAECP